MPTKGRGTYGKGRSGCTFHKGRVGAVCTWNVCLSGPLYDGSDDLCLTSASPRAFAMRVCARLPLCPVPLPPVSSSWHRASASAVS